MGALKRSFVGLVWLFAAAGGLAQELNWVQVTSYLSARMHHAMAYDAARGQVVLFGGSGGGSLSNETWVWDGTDWVKKLPSMAPSARAYSAMAYDLVRERMVLFGGTDSDY
jgi:hypothetical protein